MWGINCPMLDIDWIVSEYNNAEPAAIVEYKHHSARLIDLREANYRVLANLAGRHVPPLPFIVAWRWPNWSFYVHPCNAPARAIYKPNLRALSEQRFVRSLMFLRGQPFNERILKRLSAKHIPDGALLPIVTEAKM